MLVQSLKRKVYPQYKMTGQGIYNDQMYSHKPNNSVSINPHMQGARKVVHTHSHRQCESTGSRNDRSRIRGRIGRVPNIIPFNHDRPPVLIVEVIPTQTSIL